MSILTCPKCGTRNRVQETLAAAHQPVCGQCGAPLGAPPTVDDSTPQAVTDESFVTDVIDASEEKPVLVDAWAEWCAPCRLIAPALDQLAAESAGRYKIAKLNIDENRQTAVRYNINSIPTLLLFKHGQLADRMVGAQPKHAIASFLARHS